MKRFNSILVLITLLSINLYAQKNGDHYKNIGNLDSAMYTYGAAFFQNPSDTENAYELSRTLSLMGMVDTAFYFLEVALVNNNSLMPLADSELYFLSAHPKWKNIQTQQLEKFQKENGAIKNPEYALQLISLIQKDQAFNYHQQQAFSFYQENGRGPHWLYPILTIKGQNVQTNFKEIVELLEKHGWPTFAEVGELAADAPLLVINHMDDQTIQKKYLPQIKEACLAGQGNCMEYAKIQDELLLSQGEPQEYGMQFRMNKEHKREPYPIRDPETVDQRRLAIGLEPLKAYLKRKIDYDFDVKQK